MRSTGLLLVYMNTQLNKITESVDIRQIYLYQWNPP